MSASSLLKRFLRLAPQGAGPDSFSSSIKIMHVMILATLFACIFIYFTGIFLMQDIAIFKNTLPIFISSTVILFTLAALIKITRRIDWSLTITYGLMLLITYIQIDGIKYIMYPFAFYGLYRIMAFKLNAHEFTTTLLMGAIAGATILGCNRGIAFDILQRLSAGSAIVDTIYHASLAAMIKNYGVASTGLNGLIETPYHIFSHELVAALSKLSGVGVFELYGAVPQLLFSPVLILCVVSCCYSMCPSKLKDTAFQWAICCIILSIIPLGFSSWAVWDSYFVSESYMVSLGLFLVSMPLLFIKISKLGDVILTIILTAFIARAKGPVALIYWSLWFLKILLINKRLKIGDLLAFAGLTIAIGFTTYESVTVNAPRIISFFEFIQSYSAFGYSIIQVKSHLHDATTIPLGLLATVAYAVTSFIFFHFIVSWVTAYIAFKHDTAFGMPGNFIFIFILGSIMAGLLVVLFFKIDGGSAYYFTNVSLFFSLPFFMIYTSQKISNLNLQKSAIRCISETSLLSFFLVLVILLNAKNAVALYASHNKNSQTENLFVKSLINIQQNAPVNIYLNPQPNSMLHNPITNCAAKSMVYSAISERPWINVIVPNAECFYEHYGYPQYGLTVDKQILSTPARLLPDMKELSWQ